LASREEILNMPESIISRMKAHRPLDARVAVNDTRFCRKIMRHGLGWRFTEAIAYETVLSTA
jgi:hypothetical protein